MLYPNKGGDNLCSSNETEGGKKQWFQSTNRSRTDKRLPEKDNGLCFETCPCHAPVAEISLTPGSDRADGVLFSFLLSSC